MRLEVRDYMRVSGKLLGLVHEEGALTQTERQAIVSFAQEIERKLLPLSSTICPGPSPTLQEIDGVHGLPDFKNGGAL